MTGQAGQQAVTTCQPSPATSGAGEAQPRLHVDMKTNCWILAGGLSILLWLLPVEAVPPGQEAEASHVSRQVQLALQQFESFEEARTFQDISFNRRVNRNIQNSIGESDEPGKVSW